jgi:hypothetical protein
VQQKKKHQRKYPKYESDENNGRKKETIVRWVEGQKRNEKNYVVRRVAVGKVKHQQRWGVKEDQ